MGTLERAHQQKLLSEHEARLHQLELRIAREGYEVDPAVVTEAEQIRTSVARLRDALDAPLTQAAVSSLTPDDRYQGHVAWQMRMEQTMYRFERGFEKLRNVLYVFCGLVLVIGTAVALHLAGA